MAGGCAGCSGPGWTPRWGSGPAPIRSTGIAPPPWPGTSQNARPECPTGRRRWRSERGEKRKGCVRVWSSGNSGLGIALRDWCLMLKSPTSTLHVPLTCPLSFHPCVYISMNNKISSPLKTTTPYRSMLLRSLPPITPGLTKIPTHPGLTCSCPRMRTPPGLMWCQAARPCPSPLSLPPW